MQIQHVQQELKKQHIDAALFILEETPIPSFTYITQLSITYAVLLIKQSGKPLLFVSSLDYAGIDKKYHKYLHIELLKKPLREHIQPHLKNASTLGIEFGTTSFGIVKKIQKFTKAK